MNTFESLTPRIKGAAHNIARQSGSDPDDVEQDIILAILERYAQEPEFLDQTAAYIVQHGVWKAWKGVGSVKKSDLTVDHDVYANFGPAVTSTNPWEQVSLKLAIEQAMAGLSERDQQIATSLAAGYKPHEIGVDLGISRRTVYYRMHQIKEALDGCDDNQRHHC